MPKKKKRHYNSGFEKLCEVLFNRLIYDTVRDLAWIVKARQHEIANVTLGIMTQAKSGEVLSVGA